MNTVFTYMNILTYTALTKKFKAVTLTDHVSAIEPFYYVLEICIEEIR
jgi:hypothetical protein